MTAADKYRCEDANNLLRDACKICLTIILLL